MRSSSCVQLNLLRSTETEQQEGYSRKPKAVQLRLKAETNAAGFEGGSSWCFRFMRWNQLLTRAWTTGCQKLPDHFQAPLENASSFVREKIKNNVSASPTVWEKHRRENCHEFDGAAKWVNEAWNSISEKTIATGFHKVRLITADGDVGEFDTSETEEDGDVPAEVQPEVSNSEEDDLDGLD
ncbi:hypothetical protein HPB52_023406 [Rhipicephalus sanguineus]|uniref:Uncharacterized protein n=1 Tax=Rhipicephalus sanguineus TaxID=34632 RepID=A0A9D4SPA1_RHISA|nr:hypothetical protein HPB52_023406 [Rhipicephalus sanguineus]